jgi:hypothetical protein
MIKKYIIKNPISKYFLSSYPFPNVNVILFILIMSLTLQRPQIEKERFQLFDLQTSNMTSLLGTSQEFLSEDVQHLKNTYFKHFSCLIWNVRYRKILKKTMCVQN